MSKSAGNYVGVTDPPEEMFGKVMSVPDDAMDSYYRLVLAREPDNGLEPGRAKRALARGIVERFHDAAAATAAEEHFDRVFVRHEAPEEVEEVEIKAGGEVHLPALLAEHFGISRSEGRRLIAQGGVKVDGETVAPERLDVPASELDGRVVQVGKRRYRRFRVT
jgi:tyrosyl-tRNA synthetase